MVELPAVLAPLPSPFTDDGSGLSEVRIARLMRRLKDAGVRGVVIASDTGEFGALNISERKLLTEICVREAQGDQAVIVHVSTLSTAASLDLAQHAARHGARAALVMAPYYGDFTNQEIASYFKAIAQYAEIPLIILASREVTKEVEDAISDLPRVSIAHALGEVPIGPSAFVVNNSECRPEAVLCTEDRVKTNPSLRKELYRNGYARAVKSILALEGYEFGSVRGPYADLPREQAQELLGYFQTA